MFESRSALVLSHARRVFGRNRQIDGRNALFVAVCAAITLAAATCAYGAQASTTSSVQRLGVATAAMRDKVRAANADAKASTAHVTITLDSLSAMMEQDVAASRTYLDWVRGSQGDAAAARLEANIRSPYQKRIDLMKAQGVDHQDLDVPVVTVWGSLTFSARSYDVNFGPMDPVSLLFTGTATPDSVYQDLTTADSCMPSTYCPSPPFQDDKAGLQARGYGCDSQTQWVLMGDAGEPLQWQPSTRAVMGSGDKCLQGVRDHMRIFGGVTSPVFGSWSVGTPHREIWNDGSGKFGHIIQSWNDARNRYAAFWQSFAQKPGAATAFTGLNWGTGGFFQNVEFDGRGTAIELCPCP
ncbi:MAG TPA: hypothetical protein VH951_02180 [Dehalococcoidia bacterium]|jgi:hypothetical protein